MTDTQTYSRIIEMIQERRGESFEVTPNMQIRDDLGADSVDLMEFIIALEDEFNIEIPDEQLDNLISLQDVVDYINIQKK